MQTELLIEQISNEIGVVKKSPNPFILSGKLIVAFIIYVLLLLPIFHPRPDLSEKLLSPLFASEIIALVFIIVSSCLASAILSFPDLYQKKNIAFTPIIAFLLFALVLLLEWLADKQPAPLPEHEVKCFVCIIGFSIIPAILLFYNMRRIACTHYAHAGCTAMLSAFAVGALVLRLSEPTDSISHLLQWHYLPMLVIGLLGMLCGKLFLRW